MDLLQDEEETNSLLELKEESEVPSPPMLNKTKQNNVEPPLVEEEDELTLDRAMQLASLRERDDPEADDLFHRLYRLYKFKPFPQRKTKLIMCRS